MTKYVRVLLLSLALVLLFGTGLAEGNGTAMIEESGTSASAPIILNAANHYEAYVPLRLTPKEDVVFAAESISWSLHVWVSFEGMGEQIWRDVMIGDWVYLNYEINYSSGSPMNPGDYGWSYTVTECIYNTDGSLRYSSSYDNSRDNWIGVRYGDSDTTGRQSGSVVITGDLSNQCDVTWELYDSEPSIVTNPSSKNVLSGNTATFTVAASGTHLSYQWYYMSSGSSYKIYGATSTSYSVTASSTNSGRMYYCEVSNYGHTIYSAKATLTTLYSVSYSANGGYGAPSSQTKTHGQTLYLSNTVPLRSNYSFEGWALSSNANTALYQPGGAYTADASETLYAVWKPIEYTISYNANGGTGAPGEQTKIYGQTLYLSSTVPSRSYYAFQGWGLSSNTTDVSYHPGDAYTANESRTLYAVWKPIEYTISYNANGGTGAPGEQTKIYGQTLYLSTTVPSWENHTFLGWGLYSNSTASTYQPGAAYTADVSTTLYAVWKSNEYTISFDANGGIGAPGKQTKIHGQTLYLPATVPSWENHTFLGWGLSSDATAASYQPSDAFTINDNKTLYAVWKPDTYTIHYDANGGIGAPPDQVIPYGTQAVISDKTPTYGNRIFLGWAYSTSAEEAVYQPLDVVNSYKNMNLYAVWQEQEKHFQPETDGYSFDNSGSSFGYTSGSFPIPYEPSFTLIYGDTVAGKYAYNSAAKNGWYGNCCGMASTAALLYQGGSISPNSFGKNNTFSLSVGNSNGDISVKAFIEAMQIAQYTDQFASVVNSNLVMKYQLNAGSTALNQLCQVVENGAKQKKETVIAVGSGSYGHALLAYAVENVSDSEARIIVYDCNDPGKERYILVKKDTQGRANAWSYEMGGYYGTWGSEIGTNDYISYVPYSTIASIWNNRGNLYSNHEVLSYSGRNLSITNFDGVEVARIVNGKLNIYSGTVYEMPNLNLNGAKMNAIFLPRDYYTVKSTDGSPLTLSMADHNLGASVVTTSSEVSFAVDETSNINSVIVENASINDTYSVSLSSSYKNVQYENVVVSGTGRGSSISISNNADNLAIMNCNIESLNINGEEQVTFLISAFASQGGSIAPAGDIRMNVTGNQKYVFTPDFGYEVERVLIDGIDLGPMTEYSFENVLKDHTIMVYFKQVYDISQAKYNQYTKTVAVSYLSKTDATIICAVYQANGKMIAARTMKAAPGSGDASLSFTGETIPSDVKFKIILADDSWTPVCPPCMIP